MTSAERVTLSLPHRCAKQEAGQQAHQGLAAGLELATEMRKYQRLTFKNFTDLTVLDEGCLSRPDMMERGVWVKVLGF